MRPSNRFALPDDVRVAAAADSSCDRATATPPARPGVTRRRQRYWLGSRRAARGAARSATAVR